MPVNTLARFTLLLLRTCAPMFIFALATATLVPAYAIVQSVGRLDDQQNVQASRELPSIPEKPILAKSVVVPLASGIENSNVTLSKIGESISSFDPSGIWMGVHYDYPSFSAVKVSLEWTDEKTGMLKGKAEMLEYTKPRNSEPRFELMATGNVHAKVDLHTGEMRFEIDGISKKNPRFRGNYFLFRGVFAVAPDSFAASRHQWHNGKPKPDRRGGVGLPVLGNLDSVFVHGEAEGKTLLDMAFGLNKLPSEFGKFGNNGTTPSKQGGGFGGRGGGRGGSRQSQPAKDPRYALYQYGVPKPPPEQLLNKLRAWAATVENEYGEKKLSIVGDKDEIFNFFDKPFEEHFGLPFDKIPHMESVTLNRLLDPGRRNLPPELAKEFKKFPIYHRYFGIGGTGDRIEVIAAIWPRRTLRRWQQQRLEWLMTTPRIAEPSQVVHGVYEANKTWAHVLLPSEKSARQALSTLAYKIRDKAIRKFLPELLQNATDYDTLCTLLNWKNEIDVGQLRSVDSKSEWYTAPGRVRTKVKQVLPIVLQKELDSVGEISDSYESIEKCHRHHNQFSAKFQQFENYPSFQHVSNYWRSASSSLIERHFETFLMKLEDIPTQKALDEFTAEHFPFDLDITARASDAIFLAIEVRRKQLTKSKIANRDLRFEQFFEPKNDDSSEFPLNPKQKNWLEAHSVVEIFSPKLGPASQVPTFSDQYTLLRNQKYKPVFERYAQSTGAIARKIDEAAKSSRPQIVSTSKIRFSNSTLKDIFHGDFEAIKKRTAQQFGGYNGIPQLSEADSRTKAIVKVFGNNVDVRKIVNIYVYKASEKLGSDQINGATEVTTHDGKTLFADRNLAAAFGSDEKGVTSLLHTLQQLRSNEFAKTALAIEKDIAECFSVWEKGGLRHQQLIENLRRFSVGSESIQEEQKSLALLPWALPDQFFPEAVYKELYSSQPPRVNSKSISSNDKARSVELSELAKIALSRLLIHADAMGIPRSRVSKAIVEGKFCPDPRDVRLAFHGLADSSNALDGESVIRFFSNYGFSGPLFDGEECLKYEEHWNQYRHYRWNKMFGSLGGVFEDAELRNAVDNLRIESFGRLDTPLRAEQLTPMR